VDQDRVTPTSGGATTFDDGIPDTAAARTIHVAETDAELVRRFQADELEAFETFFNRHKTFIYRTAYGLTGDPDVAEEVLQDTFVRAYRHRASLRSDVSPLPWLHRVALNLCYSRLIRKRLPVRPIADSEHDLTDAASGPYEMAERRELAQAVRQGIASLSPGQRSVVVLRYLHGLSLQETSSILGIRQGTVKSRLHYALHHLREILSVDDEPVSAIPTAVLPAPRHGEP
jgi:RNA polymerase sigma-70 factor, ECF subfamily